MTAAPEANWPYDAHRNDPLTALRIPVVGTSHPRWAYIIAFDLDEIDADGNRPDDHETRLLRSFLNEYIDYWYLDSYKAKLAERPFDIDGGANGFIFRKWGPDDWGYRQRTWTYGPLFWPGPAKYRENYGNGPGTRQHSLLELMDHLHSRRVGRDEPSERWLKWKAAHPDLFGVQR